MKLALPGICLCLLAASLLAGPAAADTAGVYTPPSIVNGGGGIDTTPFINNIKKLLPETPLDKASINCYVDPGQLGNPIVCDVCTQDSTTGYLLPVYPGNRQNNYGIGVGGPDGKGLLSFGPFIGLWVGTCNTQSHDA